jgi:predicted DNA-binding protein
MKRNKDKQINVRCTADEYHRLNVIAAKKDMTASELVRELIKKLK